MAETENKLEGELPGSNGKSNQVIRNLYPFPKEYEPLRVLKGGCFRQVLECIKVDAKETVAVKLLYPQSSVRELYLLQRLKLKNLSKYNIVKFIDSFKLPDNRVGLVFEMLDMTLYDFMGQRGFSPLQLNDVRSITQQIAIALYALKKIKVVHADIRLSNIMLVDHQTQPLRAKLIDFEDAFKLCKTPQVKMNQVPVFRAPEIILGLPFSEAIDMWSLGVVMLAMVFGLEILPETTSESQMVQWMVWLLGVPPDHLLNGGVKSDSHFQWVYNGYRQSDSNSNPNAVRKGVLQKCLTAEEPGERKECIDLLLAMLRMDATQRINPSQVIAHRFINWGASKNLNCPVDFQGELRDMSSVESCWMDGPAAKSENTGLAKRKLKRCFRQFYTWMTYRRRYYLLIVKFCDQTRTSLHSCLTADDF